MYCPAFTDGALGDVIYFNTWKESGFIVDLVKDVAGINNTAIFAKKNGMIVLGGGVIKHHINNANMMKGGADFSVCINTATEVDGSDSGARPDEAKSWGKIRLEAKPVKVYAENSLVVPILFGETFVRNFELAKRT